MGNLLQEVAGNHAVALWGRTEEGFATEPLMVKLNLIFVMTRMLIRVDDYPRWGDHLEVETWFQKEGRIAARRDWTVTCPSTGSRLGGATSMWVMINTKTRRIAKLPTEILERLDPFMPDPSRYSMPGRSASEKMPEIDERRAVVHGPKQVVRRGDIDMNGHVNNVTYIAWALETVPDDVYRDRRLAEIEIDFKAECNYGDVVESVAQQVVGWEFPSSSPAYSSHGNGNGNGAHHANGAASGEALTFVHVLQACSTEGEARSCKEFARVRTTWVPRG